MKQGISDIWGFSGKSKVFTDKQLLWLTLVQIGFVIPISLGYYQEVIIGVVVLLIIPYFFYRIENAIILLPLFIFLPITLSSSLGLQLSEIGIFSLFLLYIGTLLYSPKLNEIAYPAIVPIMVFLLASVISLMNARFLTAGIKQVIRLIEAFVFIFYIVINYVEKWETVRRIIVMFVVAGLFASLYGLYQFKAGGENTWGFERRIFGLLGGGYGAFIGSSIVCAVSLSVFSSSKTIKWLMVICLPLLTAALILSQTRAWMGSTVVALIFVITRMKWRRLLIRFFVVLILTITVVYLLLYTNSIGILPRTITQLATENSLQLGLGPSQNQGKYLSTLSRLYIWWKGFQVFLTHPIFGVGIGNLRFRNMITGELGNPANEETGYVDNQYLNVLYEMGVFGFLAWMGLLYVIYKKCKELLKISIDNAYQSIVVPIVGSLIVFLTGGLFWCITATHEMAVMFAFLFGLLLAVSKLQISEAMC